MPLIPRALNRGFGHFLSIWIIRDDTELEVCRRWAQEILKILSPFCFYSIRVADGIAILITIDSGSRFKNYPQLLHCSKCYLYVVPPKGGK